MKAEIKDANGLFYNPVRYEIPVYQRPYVWEEEKQWHPMWEDVARTAEEFLESNTSSTADHFLGAIVLQQQSGEIGAMPRWIVIDGQQRLTTLQLLLDAAEFAFREFGEPLEDEAANLHDLIENSRRRRDPQDEDTRFKVWPTAGDQPHFRQVMAHQPRNTDQGEDDEDSRIVEAHRFFRAQVANWLGQGSQTMVDRAYALRIALSEKVKVAAISLDHTDNAHIIFETLNARGTPLLDWDLAKNFLLHQFQLRHQNPATLYGKYFEPLETDEWWRQDVRRGSVVIPRIDQFLYYWLILRTQKWIRADGVFTTLADYTKNKQVEDVVADLSIVARHYRDIETGALSEPWKSFLPRWKAMQATVMTPHLLWLRDNKISGNDLRRTLTALDSYFVRRAVCRNAARGMNREMTALLEELTAAKGISVADAVLRFLSTPTRSLKWPDDAEFREQLINSPLYQQLTRARTHAILAGLEQELQSPMSGVTVTTGFTIEHVLPQTWAAHYPIPKLPAANYELRRQEREVRLHTLGNLTLTNGRLGSILSNRSWPEKRQTLQRHDALFLNRELLNRWHDHWDDETIVARGQYLADLAIEIWPSAENI